MNSKVELNYSVLKKKVGVRLTTVYVRYSVSQGKVKYSDSSFIETETREVCQRIEKQSKSKYQWWHSNCARIQKKPAKTPYCVIVNGQLYSYISTRGNDKECAPWKLCVPNEQQKRELTEKHKVFTAGHLGVP